MDCHFLLQGIFPTQGLNPGLLHCSQILYHLNQQGIPTLLAMFHYKRTRFLLKKKSFDHRMLEKFWFPFHSSVFHINKAWVTDFTWPVFWKTTLAHEAWRGKRRPENRASISESEAEEGTVGKRAGPQGLRMQPPFQASHLSCRKEGAEPCCHQRR